MGLHRRGDPDVGPRGCHLVPPGPTARSVRAAVDDRRGDPRPPAGARLAWRHVPEDLPDPHDEDGALWFRRARLRVRRKPDLHKPVSRGPVRPGAIRARARRDASWRCGSGRHPACRWSLRCAVPPKPTEGIGAHGHALLSLGDLRRRPAPHAHGTALCGRGWSRAALRCVGAGAGAASPGVGDAVSDASARQRDRYGDDLPGSAAWAGR